MQDMRSFFGRGIWDTIFLALFDSWRMELPKELKGELLTNDIGLLWQRRSDLSRYPARRLHRIKAGRRWPSPPLLSNLVFGTDRDWSEHQGGAQYHDDGADESLGRLKWGGQRGWITFSKYLSTGTARCTRAARCRVGKGRVAMPRGKAGAGWPAIIWNAGIMSSRPARIETPGAIATRASSSMMMPKERLTAS